MTKPKVGSKLTYNGSDALGLAARIADPDINDADNGTYDSPAMDLNPGTTVEVVGYDEERDLTIVGWVDRDGNQRTTSVDADGWDRG